MLFAIYACEDTYGGLHGMESHAVVECTDENEANDIGLEMSLDVIESYDCIYEALEEEAAEEYEVGSDEWSDYLDSLRREHTAYQVYPILDSKGKSTLELENEFWNDKETFLREYCNV